MLQQYSTATRLVSIIQTIQLSRETGVLIAKRGGGISAEEGRIVFTNGRVTEVKVNKRSASDAFNYISTWENCLVSFIPQDHSKSITHLFEKSSLATGVLSEDQKKPGVPSGPLPKGARPVHEHSQNQSYTTPLDSNATQAPNSSLSISPAKREPVIYIPFLMQPLPIALRKIEQMGLSRAHRQFILLVDGKRSTEDLAHIMGRTVDTVRELLHDLVHLGLI
jgi:hypothetical protein